MRVIKDAHRKDIGEKDRRETGSLRGHRSYLEDSLNIFVERLNTWLAVHTPLSIGIDIL